MKGSANRSWLHRLAWIFCFAMLWQCTVWSGAVSPLLLPSISKVLSALWIALAQGQLLMQILFSVSVILIGIVLSVAFALLFAALSLRSSFFGSFADTLSMLAHPLPAIAILPLLIVWFGVGFGSIVAVITHSVLWPVYVNLLAGFSNVPSVYIQTAQSFRLGPVKLLSSVYIPASAPYLLSGLRTGWARAWRALISAEMIFGAVGKTGGIGWFLFKSRVMMNTPSLFAGILVVIAVSLAIEHALSYAERQTIRRWGCK